MHILGIDTSCDDTAISILKIEKCKLKILSNVVSSQVKIHAKYGGVYPFLAKREHQRNLPIVLKKALRQAQGKQFDLIGVTVGPGLEPCLWQGINFAKELAQKIDRPIIPINHIEAHILANFLNLKSKILNLKSIFPAVCLVVSGGHTQLILMRGIGQYKILGETRDDAAGECLDKVARILGLGYPGGPAIAKEAKKYTGCTHAILPRPMMYSKNYDFSFSGLKTAVLYDFKSQPPEIRKSKEYIRVMSREIQQAVIDVLIQKTTKAVKDFGVKSIILGGGVAANDELRKHFKSIVNSQKSKVNFFAPAKKFCTDNAAMIALTAFFHKEVIKDWPSSRNLTSRLRRDNTPKAVKFSLLGWQKIKANANLHI